LLDAYSSNQEQALAVQCSIEGQATSPARNGSGSPTEAQATGGVCPPFPERPGDYQRQLAPGILARQGADREVNRSAHREGRKRRGLGEKIVERRSFDPGQPALIPSGHRPERKSYPQLKIRESTPGDLGYCLMSGDAILPFDSVAESKLESVVLDRIGIL
jgi:hypothetical protein